MSDSTDDDDVARRRVGEVLNDKWTLEKLLGVGGMAAVYESRHRNGARAALKILHRALALQPNLRERFVHEGYAANRVEHPDVVKILDDDTILGGADDGVPFLVLELLDGQSLEERINVPPPLTEHELLEIVDTVLGVLEAAHPKGIIHRDLKPENLFLVTDPENARPRVKVVDFGIARSMENRGQTVHGVPMGTPAFMAPEQAAGRVDDIDGRTDLFALGASMFAVLARRSVHEGEDPLDVMYKMAKEQAAPLRSVAPFVSKACAAIVDRALRLERDERYANATEMRDDVRAILLSFPEAAPADALTIEASAITPAPEPPPTPALAATPPPLPARALSREAPTEPVPLPIIESLPPTPKSGGCFVWVVLLALLLAAGVVAMWFALGQHFPWTDGTDAGTDALAQEDATVDASADTALESTAPEAATAPIADASPDDANERALVDGSTDGGQHDGASDAKAGDAGAPHPPASATAKPTATTKPTPKPTTTTKPTAKPTATTKPKH